MSYSYFTINMSFTINIMNDRIYGDITITITITIHVYFGLFSLLIIIYY